MFIESQKNARVQIWAGLKTKKGRNRHHAFLAEGARLTEEALQSDMALECVLFDVAANDDHPSLRELAIAKGVSIHELSPQAFAAVSDTITSQGVIAVVKEPELTPLYPSHTLVLDGVQDPGNVGTLLRCADAFGISEVCCSLTCADPFAPKVVRSSMGGLFRLSVQRQEPGDYIRAWTSRFPDGNVVMTEAEGSTACHDVPFTPATLIVIGSEAAGVSDTVRKMASIAAYIPMTSGAESLNAAIAGSIVLYESYRQRQ